MPSGGTGVWGRDAVFNDGRGSLRGRGGKARTNPGDACLFFVSDKCLANMFSGDYLENTTGPSPGVIFQQSRGAPAAARFKWATTRAACQEARRWGTVHHPRVQCVVLGEPELGEGRRGGGDATQSRTSSWGSGEVIGWGGWGGTRKTLPAHHGTN